MQVEVRHSPSLAVARAVLGEGEACQGESGSMMATSGGIEIEAKARGGMMKALKRSMLSGESFFVTTFTADGGGGWGDLAPQLPGDVTVLEVDDDGINLTKGAYLGSASTVEIDTKFGGFKSMLGGESGFLVRATGSGPVICSCYGALDVVTLTEGERVVVDSGHLVAYSNGVQLDVRKVAKGMFQSAKSGEGLVFEFTGPGRVWTQSRNPEALVGWLTAELPFAPEGSAGN